MYIFQLLDLKKGFSLPLWVAGAARSALNKLVGLPFKNYELIKIPNEKKEVKIEIHSVGLLKGKSHSLGIFIRSKFSNGKPTSFFNADLADPATHKGKENPFFKSSN